MKRRRKLKTIDFFKITKIIFKIFNKIFWVLVKLSKKYPFGAAVTVFVIFMIFISHQTTTQYYARTPDEIKYLDTLRKKYSGTQRIIPFENLVEISKSACEFIDKSKGIQNTYNTDSAIDLLIGTAIIESSLRPRFQDTQGDAIGLFQIEYGTFRDILNRVLKQNNPNLYQAINENFSTSTDKKIRFEDLQNNDKLSAIFARLKYAQSQEEIPPAGDYKAQGQYYKRNYNTSLGKGDPDIFAKKRAQFNLYPPIQIEEISEEIFDL